MTLRELRSNRETQCRFVLRFLALCFVVAGTSFLLRPDETIASINALGASLGDFTPAPVSVLRFWLTLSVAYMVLVTLLAWGAQRDLHRYRHLLLILAAGKGSSSLIALMFYVLSMDSFIYLLNFFVDGSITLTVLAVWAVVPSLPRREEAGTGGGELPERTLRAVLEALVPPGGPFPEGASSAELAARVEGFTQDAGSSAAFRALLMLLDLSPFFLPPIWMRRFSSLPLEDRVRALETWEQSSLWPRRQAFHFLKLVAVAHFYAEPEIHARLGYPRPLERVPLSQEPAERRSA